jgi:ribonuclease D
MDQRRMSGLYIEKPEQLEAVEEMLANAEILYIDTEFESRRSGTELCLLQVTDGHSAFLIDAVTIQDISRLSSIFGRQGVTWVVHAGRQDIDLLMKAFSLQHRPDIFDTQVVWSLVSAEYQVSLAYLEAILLGVRKSKGSQTSDWVRRPLSVNQLEYALGDVEDLPRIYAILNERLRDLGRPDVAILASAESYDPRAKDSDQITLSSYRNLWQLDARGQAGLKVLIQWHNEHGGGRGNPHWKSLFSIAAASPMSVGELADLKGVSRDWSRRTGSRLLDEMAEAASKVKDNGSASKSVPTPYSTFEQHYRDAWLQSARADVSASACIAPEIAFPSWLMKRIRGAMPDVVELDNLAEELTGWRGCLKDAWRQFCVDTRA